MTSVISCRSKDVISLSRETARDFVLEGRNEMDQCQVPGRAEHWQSPDVNVEGDGVSYYGSRTLL
jgi:hypothetical protein